MTEIANLHIRTMLHGTEESGDPSTVIIEAHLGFRVRPEHPGRVILKQFQKFGCQHIRNRQHLRGLVCSVAKHDALVTGTAFVHTKGNIRGLFPYQNLQFQAAHDVITVISVSQLLIVDTPQHIIHQLTVVWFMRACQLASNNHVIVLQQALDRHTAVLIVRQTVRHNGIRNLVTDFIRMSIGHLLTGINSIHVFLAAHRFSPPSLFFTVLPTIPAKTTTGIKKCGLV